MRKKRTAEEALLSGEDEDWINSFYVFAEHVKKPCILIGGQNNPCHALENRRILKHMCAAIFPQRPTAAQTNDARAIHSLNDMVEFLSVSPSTVEKTVSATVKIFELEQVPCLEVSLEKNSIPLQDCSTENVTKEYEHLSVFSLDVALPDRSGKRRDYHIVGKAFPHLLSIRLSDALGMNWNVASDSLENSLRHITKNTATQQDSSAFRLSVKNHHLYSSFETFFGDVVDGESPKGLERCQTDFCLRCLRPLHRPVPKKQEGSAMPCRRERPFMPTYLMVSLRGNNFCQRDANDGLSKVAGSNYRRFLFELPSFSPPTEKFEVIEMTLEQLGRYVGAAIAARNRSMNVEEGTMEQHLATVRGCDIEFLFGFVSFSFLFLFLSLSPSPKNFNAFFF